MLEACRTCLRLIDVDNLPFVEIETDGVQLSTESCRYKLMSLIPEMALNIVPKSLLCAECHGNLEALFEFKKKCLGTEYVIMQYFRTEPNAYFKTLDLKDVSTFNMRLSGDANISERFTSTFDDSAAADDRLVTHEDDDYLAEVVQSENTVLDLRIEPKKSPVRCQVCSKSFKRSSALEKHMLIHTDEQPYKCTICSKGFKYISWLKSHVEIHSKLKRYGCEVCPKTFSNYKSLKNHLFLHTGSRYFTCKYCDKRFVLQSSFKNHLGSHEKPHRCEVCDQRFSRKEHMLRHVGIHNGKQPYVCADCGNGFRTNYNLTVHSCTHAGKRPYQDPF